MSSPFIGDAQQKFYVHIIQCGKMEKGFIFRPCFGKLVIGIGGAVDAQNLRHILLGEIVEKAQRPQPFMQRHQLQRLRLVLSKT